MKILLTGSSGLVGTALVEYFFTKGYSIQCVQRNTSSDSTNFWTTDALPVTAVLHAVIHLAGEGVAEERWTKQKKERILMSRLEGTKKLIDYIMSLREKPAAFICASAIGYYGNRGDDILDENSSLGKGFLADVCRQWEEETERLSGIGIRTVNLRFGMVLSPRGGALHKMVPSFKARRGGVIGSGNQYISWISIRDVVRIVDFLLNQKTIKGPVNVVSPNPTTNKGLVKALGSALKRPTLFTIPGFMARLMFGQMADEMLLSSNRVMPRVLMEYGYQFKDETLDAALRYCLENAAAQQ